MRPLTRLIVSILILSGWVESVSAQPWSGIIAPSRAVDWSGPGVTGGIPVRTTICATLNPGATAVQINTAISTCPSGQVVQLTAGTYNLTAGITFNGTSNVTLRGAGPSQTLLFFTGDTSCLGQFSNICIMGTNLGYYGPGPPTNIVNWTAGYTKGATSITLSSTPGLSVGMYIVLDQLDDASDTGNVFVCVTQGTCTDQGGGGNARPGRVQRQMVRVTNIAGNVVTITPGLYMPQWRSGQSPQAWWGSSSSLSSRDGIEDLSLDGQSSGAGAANITLIFTTDSWVKNVRSLNAPSPRAHVIFYQSAHCTIRDSYLYGSVGDAGSSTNYGVEMFGTADILVENNIVQHRTTPFISDGDTGSVIAYNFSIDDHYSASPTFMQASNYSHEGGNGMVLHEGNTAIGIKGDIIHGTSNLFTFFRNRSIGWETGKTAETVPAKLYSYQRYWHFIGNVLGQSGYHNVYDAVSNTAIFTLGAGTNIIAADPTVATTVMRWGNYDTVNAAVRFNSGEVPSGIAVFPNPVPASQTLPASFYLSSKPSFWGTGPWPAVGPDITGGDVANVGGHAYKIPAQLCYEGATNDPAYPVDSDGGRVKIFTPSTCYTAAPPPSTACTPGTNCYCDCVNGPATIGSFKNAACQTKNVPVDTNKMLCEDWEAPTLHNNIGVGNGAPYYGPPYDDSFFGNCPADLTKCARGANGYLNKSYGSTTFGCAWAPGDPASPVLGHTCGSAYQGCFAGVWTPADPWQSNTFACMSFPQNGEFNAEVPTIQPPTNASGGGTGVFDGNQSLGFRNGPGRTAGPGSQGLFNGFPGTAHKNFGVTMAVAYPQNIVSSGIFGGPWKHNEYHPVQRPCNVGDALMMVHVLDNGFAPNPTPSTPFHNVIFPADNGLNNCTTSVTQAQCNASISGATIRKGQLSCDNAANFRFVADTSYLQSRDWPFGTWGCVKGEFHFGGGPGVGMSVKITLTTPNVTDMVLMDFDHFDDTVLDSNQGYNWIAWNNYANTNQPGGGVAPTTTAAYRYEDNIHITAGAPVSCAQIGYPSSVSPALQLQGGALQLCGSALCLK